MRAIFDVLARSANEAVPDCPDAVFTVNAGLEDAIAILWEILDEVTRSLLYISSKAKRLGAILKVLRSGPHAYKKDEKYKWDEDEKD